MSPNILLFFPDQWRGDWSGLEPGTTLNMPNLRRLAESGVHASRAICPSPLCAPSRACLARGLHYGHCGVASNKEDLPDGVSTFYQTLRNAGYAVLGCGKFDLHKPTKHWGRDGSYRLREWGFTDGIDNAGKLDAVSAYQHGEVDPYMEFLEMKGLARLHVDDFAARMGNTLAAQTTSLPDEAYCDNWIGKNGLQLLEQTPAERPWFLQVNFTGPHNPWDITDSMRAGLAGRPLPDAILNGTHQPEALLAVRRNYAAMIENIDDWLGRFIAFLDSTRQLERTLIVVCSDHGEMLGDRELWGKSLPWQASISVPLVVSGPDVAQGAEISDAVSTLDLTATILDWAGLEPGDQMDSVSLAQSFATARYEPRRVHCALDDWQVSLSGTYKIIQKQGQESEYYDLATDPHEMHRIEADSIERNMYKNLLADLQRSTP